MDQGSNLFLFWVWTWVNAVLPDTLGVREEKMTRSWVDLFKVIYRSVKVKNRG